MELCLGPHTAKAEFAGGEVRSYQIPVTEVDGNTGRVIRRYYVTITDTAKSSTGTASFALGDIPPALRSQPTNLIVPVHSDTHFIAKIGGGLPLLYQWRLNENPIPAATNATLTLNGVQSDQAGIYSLVASNSLGVVTSTNASLTVFSVQTSLPITDNAIVKEGSDVTFTVSASSAVPLGYQWRHNGSDLQAATSSILTLPGVRETDSGSYTVRISDGVVSVVATAATFTATSFPLALAASRTGFDGTFRLTLSGKAATDYTVDVSTDLVLWTVLTNLSSPSGTLLLADSEAFRQPYRFYRASITGSRAPAEIPNMAWIKPGTFTMGSPANEVDRSSDEGPRTQVTISRGFLMGKHEVTQGEYLAVMGSNPSNFKGDNNRPVETVSWNDAINYCAKLTVLERAAGRLPAGYAYRLPTEAEWEYAARAGSTTRFGYGDDPGYTRLGDYAWYFSNGANTTHPVGQKLANAWGLSDMHGNVWEWCLDRYGSYPGGSLTDPRGPASGSYRVIRGGSWASSRGTAGQRSAAATTRAAGTSSSVSGLSWPQVSRSLKSRA